MSSLFVRQLRPCLSMLLVMTLMTGVAYPFLVMGLSQWVFPERARGSLIHRGDAVLGSSLIGQQFTAAGYFWGRPSATSPLPYDAGASGGSNLGPMNPALIDRIRSAVAALHAADPAQQAAIPVDLVTASASGLDPDISVAAARYQAPRVARARHVDTAAVQELISRHQRRFLGGVFGEATVNVLELNLALDEWH